MASWEAGIHMNPGGKKGGSVKEEAEVNPCGLWSKGRLVPRQTKLEE